MVLAEEYNLDWLTGWNVDRSRDTIDVTVINSAGTGDRTYMAGLGTATMSLSGFWEVDADKSGPVANTLMDGSAHTVSVLPQGGAAVGERAILLNVRQTDAPMSSTIDGAVELSTGRQGSGAARGGVVLKDHAAETSVGNYAGVDAGALSTFGAIGHLHVTAFTGTDATIKITDSVDEGVYADLVTFTQATDVTSERVTVAGTVNRWTRVELTGTFTTITFAVGFARLLQ